MAETKPASQPAKSQTSDPAKGGATPPHDRTYASGESAKTQGDKLENAVDEAAKGKGDH